MNLFPKIEANAQKQQEKEFKDKVEKIEKIADDLLSVLKEKDLSLEDAQIALKCASDRINRKGSSIKLSVAL